MQSGFILETKELLGHEIYATIKMPDEAGQDRPRYSGFIL